MDSIAGVRVHVGAMAGGAVGTVLRASGKLHELVVLATSGTKLLIVSVVEHTIYYWVPKPHCLRAHRRVGQEKLWAREAMTATGEGIDVG